MKPYRTLIFAELVQESPLCTGGNRPHELVDLPLSRDGLGRPVLRGTSLAGSFVATARRLFGTLPRAITNEFSEGSGEDIKLLHSSWRFSHAHPLQAGAESDFHQHVSIDPRTQAAKDDHLFSLEALPAGIRWNFQLEISPSEVTAFSQLEAISAATLAAWQRHGGARIGRGNNHGYGWCHLENIHIFRLEAAHARLWPDAFAPERSPQQWVEYFRTQGAPEISLDDLLTSQSKTVSSPRHYQLELSGTLHVGERKDDFGSGYGIDTLSIGGHARMELQADKLLSHVIPTQGITFDRDSFDPDFTITTAPTVDGNLEPFIPGASIRGAWRAMLYRHWQANGSNSDRKTLLDTLFGSTELGGCLSVANATLDVNGYRLLWQQHVALDEFTGGVYESAKFDRLSVACALFTWQARIEGDSQEEVERLAAPLLEMLDALGNGQLPLGGGIWRGHGHVCWQRQEPQIRPVGNRGDTPWQ